VLADPDDVIWIATVDGAIAGLAPVAVFPLQAVR